MSGHHESRSLFEDINKRQQLLEVHVGGVNILLPSSKKRAIGTRGLNGCTCIVILGRAIILAHISPIPGLFEQLQVSSQDIVGTSCNHHQYFMENIMSLVRKHQSEFPISTTAWGVFSTGPEGPVQSIVHHVGRGLTGMGYEMKTEFYRERDPDPSESPEGELVSFIKEGTAQLHLESRQLWPRPATPVPISQPAEGPSQSQENDGDDGDNGDDDENGDDDDSDDDSDDGGGGGDGEKGEKDDESRAGISYTWIRQEGHYVKYDHNRRTLIQQVSPPLNENFLFNGVWFRWNGKTRLVFEDGA